MLHTRARLIAFVVAALLSAACSRSDTPDASAREVTAFLDRVKANPEFRTTFEDGGSGEGISVSCRVAG